MARSRDEGATPTSRKEKRKKTHREKKPVEEEEPPASITAAAEKSKEVSVEMEMLPETRDQTGPFVGYFPSGYDPLKNAGEDVEITVYRHKMKHNRTELVVKPSGCAVDFVGKSYVGEAATGPQMCNYAVGILDKEAGTLKIVPIATNKILRLEPRVIGKAYADIELAKEPKDGSLAEEQREKYRELTNLYGSKKNKGMTQKFQALEEQRNNPNANEFLDYQMKDVQVNKEAIDGMTETALNIPPHDLAATTPEKAYLLDKIITKVEWKHLSDILDKVQSGENFDSTAYPSFVLNRVSSIMKIKDEKKKDELSRILSYITHLVNFLNMSFQRNFLELIGQPSRSHEIPQVISQKFVKLFVDPGSNKISSEKKDLLISYILVLTLFTDQFKTKLTDIAKDLKKTTMALRPHYLQLGCKVHKGGFYTLPVPLNIPTLSRNRSRK